MSYWVKEIAQISKAKTGFNHPVLKMSNDDSLRFIREQIKNVNLQAFL
jgi:hypothetical protein